MDKFITLLLIGGAAYWYLNSSEPQDSSTATSDARQDNAAVMQRCVAQETRMSTTGALSGMGGVATTREDAERACAERHGLRKQDGQWFDR